MKKLISRIDNTVFIFLIVILLIVANIIVSDKGYTRGAYGEHSDLEYL